MSQQQTDSARRRPIGVFDSGVGGLTVLHELLVQLPHENFLYCGDTARFPYGTRTPEELQIFSLQIAELLLERDAKLIVLACNSATAAAAEPLRRWLEQRAPDVELVTVIEPESRLAVEATRSRRVGLLATPATVESGAYTTAIGEYSSEIELTTVACPDLAPIIQGGFPFDRHVVDTVRSYCGPLREAEVDTVILGCTHYPLVAPMLQRTLGRGVTLVSSGHAVAEGVETLLASSDLASDHDGEGEYRFLCSGDVEAFRTVGTRFLQMPLTEITHIELE